MLKKMVVGLAAMFALVLAFQPMNVVAADPHNNNGGAVDPNILVVNRNGVRVAIVNPRANLRVLDTRRVALVHNGQEVVVVCKQFDGVGWTQEVVFNRNVVRQVVLRNGRVVNRVVPVRVVRNVVLNDQQLVVALNRGAARVAVANVVARGARFVLRDVANFLAFRVAFGL